MWSYFIDHLNPQLAEPMAASVYAVMFLASGAFTAMLGKMFYRGALEARRKRPEQLAMIARVNSHYGADTLQPLPDFTRLTVAIAYGYFTAAVLLVGVATIAMLGPVLL